MGAGRPGEHGLIVEQRGAPTSASLCASGGCREGGEIVALNDGLSIDEDGLAAAVESETRKLRVMIHQAVHCQGRRGGSLSLTRPSGKPDFEVLVSCFSGGSLEDLEGRQVAAVLINESAW